MSLCKVTAVSRGLTNPENVYIKTASGSVWRWKRPLSDKGYERLLSYVNKLKKERRLLQLKDGNWIMSKDRLGKIVRQSTDTLPVI